MYDKDFRNSECSLKGFKRQTTYIMINMKNTNECEKRAQIV